MTPIEDPLKDLNETDETMRQMTERTRQQQRERQKEQAADAGWRARDEGPPETIARVETQVMVDGEPVIVSEAARTRPGETPQTARGRLRDQARHEARQDADHLNHEPHSEQRPTQHGHRRV